MDFGIGNTWVWILVLPFIHAVSLHKLVTCHSLNSLNSHSFWQKDEGNNSLTGILRGLNEISRGTVPDFNKCAFLHLIVLLSRRSFLYNI